MEIRQEVNLQCNSQDHRMPGGGWSEGGAGMVREFFDKDRLSNCSLEGLAGTAAGQRKQQRADGL